MCGGGGSLQAKYLVLCCCNRDSLKFDMQHDYVLKKWNFDLLTLSPGSGWGSGGGGRGSACKQTIWYLGAAIVILLNLMCNMTMF